MSAAGNGDPGSPSNRENDAVGEEESSVAPISGGDSDRRSVSDTVASGGKEARVSLVGADKSAEHMTSDPTDESGDMKVGNEESGVVDATGGAPDNNPTSSVSRGHKKSEGKIVRNSMGDYDSLLSEFDQFASGGTVGYEIGDMVWGKVKSHPWWPGQVYNEAFASHSVQRSKRGGHLLVAFFGDSSYGWFHPLELVHFEENFVEKSQQTSSRSFVKAVEEAVDEISRRQGVGLACCCRNEFNFRPSTVENHFVVGVGDYEPGVYSLGQINKAREDFRTKELVLFIRQLALEPMTDQHWNIEFIKNKATILGCRRAIFEEFDETYAQAFGSVPVRPPRPTAPMVVNPSKALLSGRQVFADTPGKEKLSVKSTKSKEQTEKEKYLFVRRDAPVHTKTKKKNPVHVGQSAPPLLVDGSGSSGIPVDSGIKSPTFVSGIDDGHHLPSSVIQPFEGSKKIVEGGQKNAMIRKRQAGEMNSENASPDMKKTKKRKKGTSDGTSANIVQPLTNSDSGAAVEKVSGMQLDNPKKDDSRSHQEIVNLLSNLVSDLHALALDPFHGVERGCPASTQLAFLKYRSLVYQKSLLSSPPTRNEAIEAHSTPLPVSTALLSPTDKSNDKSTVMKHMKPSARPIDDPTIGGKKQGPSDRPETIKRKKKLLGVTQGIKKKTNIAGLEETTKKKKIIDDSKLVALGKKNLQKPAQSQRETTAPGSVPPQPVKFESQPETAAARSVSPKPVKSEYQRETGAASSVPPKAVKFEAQRETARSVPPKGFKFESQRETAVARSVPPKAAKFESGNKRMNEQAARVSTPTMLVMKFPPSATLPSSNELRARFARFGALDHNATRIFWKTSTCRLVYRRKADAEEALDFAVGSNNLFGSNRVRCYVREVGDDASMESEPVKPTSLPRESAFEQNRSTAKTSAQQLKSCLKKPSNDEGGNGNGKSARVKFVLGGSGEGGSSKTRDEQVSSFPVAVSPSLRSFEHSMEASGIKNLPKFTPHSSSIATPSSGAMANRQFQKAPINVHGDELLPRSLNANVPMRQMPIPKDISQQLLDLLTQCNDVVNNVTGVLGYVPYHAL